MFAINAPVAWPMGLNGIAGMLISDKFKVLLFSCGERFFEKTNGLQCNNKKRSDKRVNWLAWLAYQLLNIGEMHDGHPPHNGMHLECSRLGSMIDYRLGNGSHHGRIVHTIASQLLQKYAPADRSTIIFGNYRSMIARNNDRFGYF